MSSTLNHDVSTKHITQKIFSLALPMAASQFINVASGFFCMAMLAHLGHEVLAASALIVSTQMSLMVFGISLLFSLSILVGHAYGAGEYRKIGNYVQQAWTLGLIIGIPIMIVFWHIGSLLIYFGQTPEIAAIVQKFFHAYVFGVIPGLFAIVNQLFGYGVHKKTLIISTSFMSVCILLITAYTLIFGKFGFPKLGVAGLGYAMALQVTFFFVFTSLFYYFEKSFQRFDLFHYRVHQHIEYMLQMFQVGWPISLQMGGEMLSLFVSAAMIGWLGTTSLAAYQVVNQSLFLTIVPIFSLVQASSILVGQACGSKQFHEIKILGHASIICGIVMSLLVAIIFLLFPRNLAAFYLDIHQTANVNTVHLIVILFAIVGCSQIFDTTKNVLTGVLRGMFDTKYPMMLGLAIIWMIGIPLGYILAFKVQLGIIGMSLGTAVGMVLSAIIIYHRWWVMSNRITTQKINIDTKYEPIIVGQ